MRPDSAGHITVLDGATENRRRMLPWPSNTYMRFLVATVGLSILATGLALVISYWQGAATVNQLQDQAGFTLLRNAVDLIGRSRISLEEERNSYIEDRKDSLRIMTDYTLSLLDTYNTRGLDGELDAPEARVLALRQLNQTVPGLELEVFVVDAEDRLVVHPNPELRQTHLDAHRDMQGNPVLRPMVEQARNHGTQSPEFSIYPWATNGHGLMAYKLALCRYHEPWDLVVCADLYLGDMDSALDDARLANLNELRARLREITMAETGYIYVFDESCTMIAHPTLADGNISDLLLPGEDRSLCEALKQTAEAPWGRNKISYRWDRPEDEGNYVYSKVSWCTREPTTGWYVGVSAYLDELQAPIPRFMRGAAIPALISILLVGAGLAFLLRRLLKPVHVLAKACETLGRGDLSVRAPTDAPGEVGSLCRHFNNMTASLGELRQAEQRRRRELEHLNRHLEEKVGERTRDLERKARKLEELNIRLRELDAMKSTLLSSVSHELRTPLTSIRGFAKLIAREFGRHFTDRFQTEPELDHRAKRIQQNLDIISAEGERLTRLINDVLDLAKIESGQMDWHESVFDLRELIHHCVHSLSGMLARNPSLEFSLSLPQEPLFLAVDRDRLTQVFMNLLNNALKFTEKGTVSVVACTGEGGLQVRVTDTGTGIPRPDLQRVFDKFHQAGGQDTLQDKPRGTGLGLAICHNVISRYDGLIWAESEPGSGATLVVELPGAVLRREPDLPPMDNGLAPLPLNGGKPPLILVVDDEPSIRSFLSQVFEAEGYRVATARNGFTGLDMARELKPDLMTLDIHMPGLDGRETIARIRQDPELRGMPILVISILSSRDFVGGDGALDKPIDEDQLLKMARHLILRTASCDRPCLVLGPDGGGQCRVADAICKDNTTCVNLEELMQRIEAGFQGTVFVPASLARRVDLESLAQNEKLNVVVLQDTDSI